MSKWKSSKTCNCGRFHAKRTSPLNSAHFLRILTPAIFLYFSEYDLCLTLESLKNISNQRFEGLGLCANDFSKRKASDCIYQARNRYRETHFWCIEDDCMVMHIVCMLSMYHGYVSWLCIMAMYHGYVSWLYILGQTVDPQGPFGQNIW